ncbi:hypothetical protein A6C57_05495 [Fibrella sp. ES10-3-2-2]|nr:hypothetical protein A6C57_05495 [Fibrella sp. ES10-3-2-2]
MNSSDDSTDKALKERFQRVFNDFERTPSRALKKRIWQQLPVSSTTRSGYVILAALLLLLIVGVLYGPERVLPRPIIDVQLKRPLSKPHNAGSLQAKRRSAIHLHQVAAADGASLTTSQPASSSTRSTVQQMIRPDEFHTDATAALPRQYTRSAARKARSRPTSGDQVRVFSVADQAVNRRPRFRTDMQVDLDSPLSISVRASPEPARYDSVFGQEALVRLQPVVICPLRVPDYAIRRQVVQLPQQPTEATDESHRASLRWLASVSPLSTFQFMTIVTRPETYVQRVDAPATFSAPTWGYQVSGGVMWRQFAVKLMAGQLRRWAYYDLATNEYRIEATGQNEYRITRLGQSVAENSSLTLLGASLAKEYTLGLGKRPGQYAARVGGQGTYLPATGQTLLWGQAALTTAIPLRSAYSIQVGPMVQHGFSRLFSGDRQLNIHPFLVGASFTIRPTAH